MGLVTVKVFDNSIEAHIWKSRFENEGIKCYLFDENMVSLNLLFNVMVGGIKLKINETDIERANELIKEIDNLPLTNDNNEIIECPNCTSSDLISDYKSIKGIKGILSIITSFIFMVFPIYYKTIYRCNKCGTEFKQNNKN